MEKLATGRQVSAALRHLANTIDTLDRNGTEISRARIEDSLFEVMGAMRGLNAAQQSPAEMISEATTASLEGMRHWVLQAITYWKQGNKKKTIFSMMHVIQYLQAIAIGHGIPDVDLFSRTWRAFRAAMIHAETSLEPVNIPPV
jgi:hypothetical protein